MTRTLRDSARRAASRLVACAVIAALPAIAGADEANRAALVVGMVNAQTGPPARIGIGYRTAATAVFDDVNVRGGVHGRRLVLLAADDGYEPDQTLEQTLDIVDDGNAIAMLGYVGTATANVVLPLLVHRRVPIVGVFSGSQTLRAHNDGGFFHLRPSYADEAEALVDRLVAGGARSIGVVYQDDGFGHDVLRGVEQALFHRGLVPAAVGSYQRGTLAIRTAVATMRERSPDAIVLAATEAAGLAFIEQARAAGIGSRFASLSFFVTTDARLGALRAGGERMLISQVVPYPGDDRIAAVRECRRILSAQGGEPLGHTTLEGCLNARTLVQGLIDAGPDPTRATLTASLESMRGFDLGGITVSFSRQDHQAARTVFMTEVVDGRMVPAR